MVPNHRQKDEADRAPRRRHACQGETESACAVWDRHNEPCKEHGQADILAAEQCQRCEKHDHTAPALLQIVEHEQQHGYGGREAVEIVESRVLGSRKGQIG